VHPFDDPPQPVSKPEETLTDELPVDLALGKVDYLEILGFSDHKTTAAVWYRLLNLGFRLPAAGGTDAMANYASLRGPVGMNRVFVRVPDNAATMPQKEQVKEWLAALKAGHSMATNGPLLGLRVGGAGVGDELKFGRPQAQVGFSAHLRSIVPVDHLELVCNGRTVKSLIARSPLDHADLEGSIPLKASGWCVLRAFTDSAREQVMDNYVYATTSPVYITIAGAKPHSPEDARYFAAWTDRLTEAVGKHADWNGADEKRGVLDHIARAKAVYVGME
jgi:TolB protein